MGGWEGLGDWGWALGSLALAITWRYGSQIHPRSSSPNGASSRPCQRPTCVVVRVQRGLGSGRSDPNSDSDSDSDSDYNSNSDSDS